MKVILSRKGFDTENGGVPSPIMPDGTLLSLPIPMDKNEVIQYEQLQYNGKSYAQIITELTKGKFSGTKCHLDPDIRKDVLMRSEKWQPAVGQEGAALTHLLNEGVGKDDLFLFFGWFQEVEEINGKYQYVNESDDKHVIYGYLQVAEILHRPTQKQYPWLGNHPHLDRGSNPNAIFVARPKLSWNENVAGAGCLNYQPKLVLTNEGHPCSHWHLPDCLKDVIISYHTKDAWKDGYFQSAHRGQDFVIASDSNEKIKKWVKGLIVAEK
jgi:hypothetical protein